MSNINITKDIKYVGVNDHDIDLFEGQYKVDHGMSYNSYLIIDEKIAILDSVEFDFSDEWIENIKNELNGAKPEYLIISHMEPDHSGSIMKLVETFPDIHLVGNVKTFTMFDQFFPNNKAKSRLTVKEHDVLDLGKHKLTFIFAPMVHWPEVMFTYDSTDEILFSADAFGKFGSLDYDEEWTDEARRYYFAIVGKYGKNVMNVFEKLGCLELKKICSLHGPILTKDLNYYVETYKSWATYKPDKSGTLVACCSIYGHTMAVAKHLKTLLEEKNQKVEIVDLARTPFSVALAKAFEYDKLVLATITYNATLMPFMKTFIDGLVQRNYQNRKIGFIENGTWAAQATKLMKTYFEKSKDIEFLNSVSIKSASYNDCDLHKLAEQLEV